VIVGNPAPHVTAWGWFWLVWLFSALGVETYWLIANTANTLSRQIWAVEGIDLVHPLEFAEWSPLHWAIAFILWGLFAWLSVHFPFGYLR
jgi:hypothetical protein